MYESHGWWFPDAETHFPEMLAKSVSKGGPAEYQQPVRVRSLNLTRNKRSALDIGANVGLWSRDLVQHFEHVVAFEPVAQFRECLQKNVSASNFSVKPIALGDRDHWVHMVITEGNTGHTYVDENTPGGKTVMVTLDSLNYQNIDYIKIDCEGFEYRVLKGAEQTIKTWRPTVVIEQKPHKTYSKEYAQHAAVELLQSWGMVRLDQVKDDWIMGWR